MTKEQLEKLREAAFEKRWESIQDKYQNFPEDDTPPMWFIKEIHKSLFDTFMPLVMEMRETLEFYSDRDNWAPADDEYAWKIEDKITSEDLDEYVPAGLSVEFECGGKRARTTLAHIDEQLMKLTKDSE